MARFFNTRAVALVLCFSLLIAHAVAAETFTTTFSKRNIPVDRIRRALQPHLNDVQNIDLSRVVYEIIDGNQLVGFKTKLNLEDDTATRSTGPSTSLKYMLNGKERLLTPSPTVRHGKGFTVIYRASDKRVMHVFGNGLNLKPVDPAYPDVFVNTLATSSTSEMATDPVEVVKRIAVTNQILLATQNLTVRQAGSCAGGTTHFMELAVAFDNQFCALFSDDESIATTAVQTLVNQADEVFREFTCVSIALVHIEAHCNDPADPYTVLSDFSRAEPGEPPSTYIQRAFGEFWEESRTDVRRDAAYFLSGFEEGSSTAGRAGIGASCTRSGYGWSEQVSLTVFIHELGHLAGSQHTEDGIMFAGGFSGGPIFFSQDSINMITTSVDSTSEECLSTSAPVCDTTCPGPCMNGQCIARYSADASPGVVPCSAIGGSFRCVDSEEFFSTEYFFAADCPPNFKYVAREVSEANEPDTFCCTEATESTTSDVVPANFRFIRFTLRLPEGDRVFEEYIEDTSVIETRTLLRTELLPSCQLPGAPRVGDGPSASQDPIEEPMSTPVPSTSSEIPTSTPVPSKVANESSTPVETPMTESPDETPDPQSGAGTCGAGLAGSETLTCGSNVTEPIEVSFPEGQELRVMVRLVQRQGVFLAVLRARNGGIRRVAAMLTTDDSLGPNDVGAPILYEDMPERVTIEEDAFEMALPVGASTCCGENLFLYVQLEVCLDGECIISRAFTRSTEILCSDPCSSSPGGTVVPFSTTKWCPSCE